VIAGWRGLVDWIFFQCRSGERGERGQACFGLEQHGFDLGELASEHVGHGLEFGVGGGVYEVDAQFGAWVFSDGTKGEADILGICDGKVVSGEVKMSGYSFTKTQVDKNLDIAQRLGSDVYLIVATNSVKNGAEERAQPRCDELGVQLLFLERIVLLR